MTGTVDKHFRAIAEEVGLDIERVKAAITFLESPDEESRSPEQDGRRLIPLDEHRSWGWQIVNYGKYRAIRNEDDRREQNREAQRRYRERHNPRNDDISEVSRVSQDKPMQKQKQIQEEEEEENSVSNTHAREWEFPLRDLFDAFPNLNLTPAQVGVIESEIKLGDETPWKLAIEKYRLNYDPALNRYDPSKVGNLLSVFREFKAQEKRNGQHTAISAKTGQYKDKRTVEAERIEAGYARVAELRRIADEQDARQQGALLGNGHGIDYQIE